MSRRTLDIDQHYFIRAPLSRVFAALTEPRWLSRWFLASARIRPVAGSSYTFRWQGGHSHSGRVVEVVPNHRLTLTWPNRVNRVTRETRVTFELSQKGRGTLLRVHHVGYPSAVRWLPTYGATQCGWAYFSVNLRSVLENGHDLRSRWDY